MTSALSFHDVSKRFPGVLANDRVSLKIADHSIQGVVGENGAGKSTLMSLVAGLHQPDSGSIEIFGVPVTISSPKVAAELGVGMVHQEFKLVPSMTVVENVILGTAEGRGRLKLKLARRRVGELTERYNLGLDPASRISDLPIGLRQRVEILKALYGGARLLIFDEPTAVLTPQEAVDLFAAFRALIEQQRTVVFISHKLSEVTGVTDRVAVMRAGRVVGEFETATTTEEQLAELMVGRRVLLHRGTASRVALGRHVDAATRGSGVERDAPSAVAVQPRLLVDGLQVVGDLGEVAVDVASFEVRPGEILGIAGVAGNGQLELEEAIAGLRRASRGHVVIDGVEVTRASIRRRRELGLSYVPEDRVATGTHRQSTVGENFIMGAHYKSPIAQGGRLRPEPIRQYVERLLGRFDIAAGGAHARLANLSGGNIQKVVVAREIAGTPEILGHEVPRVLIASQPTRGVDVGAIEYIHAQLIQLRAKGAAVLLISFELDEILFLSDTIRVLYNGVLSEALDPEAVTERQLGLLMGGANPMLAGSTTVAAP